MNDEAEVDPGGRQGEPVEGSLTDGGSLVPAAVTDVPEPASWALMICGFGLAGFSLRSRRGAAAAARA